MEPLPHRRPAIRRILPERDLEALRLVLRDETGEALFPCPQACFDCLGVVVFPVDHTLFVARSALPQRRSLSPEAVLARVPLALLEGSSDLSQAVADWAETRGVSLRPGLRCTSLLQASEAVKHLGMAAILPTWAELAFAPGEVTTLGLPGIQSLRAPLHLVWSKRQGVVRSFLAQVAKALCTSLAGEGG